MPTFSNQPVLQSNTASTITCSGTNQAEVIQEYIDRLSVSRTDISALDALEEALEEYRLLCNAYVSKDDILLLSKQARNLTRGS